MTNVVDDNELSHELREDGESGKHYECCKTVLLVLAAICNNQLPNVNWSRRSKMAKLDDG